MQKRFTYLLLILILFISACSSEETNLTSAEIFAIRTIDINNNQNASDFLTTFKVNNPSTIKELRAFLINPTDFPNFTSTDVAKLPAESYHKITNINADNQVNLGATLKDVDGAAIIQDKDYFLGFGVLIGDDILLNTQIAEAKLTDGHFLIGKFGGTWDDNLYTNFGISAELNLSGNTLSGPFWYSNNFVSCCGGQNDGQISMRLEDDDQVSNFRYNQKLVSFMGGACDGIYTGEGQIENFTEIVVSFEGNDCEGPHTGGRIRLVKMQ